MPKWRGNKKVEEPPYVSSDYDPAQFTEEEAFQLREWQLRFQSEEDDLMRPQMNRLEFARWCVDHDIIGEFNVDEP